MISEITVNDAYIGKGQLLTVTDRFYDDLFGIAPFPPHIGNPLDIIQ